MNFNTNKIHRRDFLTTTSAAAVVPCFIPGGVLGAAGEPAASERLNVGMIGIGGMGRNHLKWLRMLREDGKVNIPAVCDIDEGRLANAVKSVGPGCTPYRDYRYLLQREDIDAVNIATPDHWHAVQTVHACETGKHVFVEKPTSCTIKEGRAMVVAAEKHKRVVQVGSQARSAIPAWQACTYNMAHKEDWLLAIKTGRRPCMDLAAAHNVATLNNLGNLSFVLDRKLNWDGKNERFVGDDYANRHLDRPQRHPYHL